MGLSFVDAIEGVKRHGPGTMIRRKLWGDRESIEVIDGEIIPYHEYLQIDDVLATDWVIMVHLPYKEGV